MTKACITIIFSLTLIFSISQAWASPMPDNSIINGIQKAKTEKLLRLYLDIFLASKDLNNAYYVAKIGCKRFPKNPYWWKKLADICQWTGRSKEAMEVYIKLYKMTKKKEYEKRAFDLAILFNRFDIAKNILENNLRKGIFPKLKDLIYVYKQSGDVFKLIKILEQRYRSTKSLAILKRLVNLYWVYGLVDKAIAAIKKLEEKRGLSIQEALLYSEMLYSQRRFEDSLAVLKRYVKKAKRDDREFWQTLSDLAWAQGDYLTAIKASRILCKGKKSRLVDYERLYLFYYSSNRLKTALRYAIEGYKRYGKPYLFLAFLNAASLLKRWDIIKKEIKELGQKELNAFSKNPNFIVIYALALINSGAREEGKKLLETALTKGFNADLLSYYIYVLMEMRDVKGIKEVVKRYKGYAKKHNELILPFVSCYLFLKDGRDAMMLIRLMPIKRYSDLLLRADVLSLMGKENEAKNIRFNVWKDMKAELSKDKKKMKNREFLENFLRVAIYFDASPVLRRYMNIGKKVLDKSRYVNLMLSYLFYIGAKDEAAFLIDRCHYPSDPWMRLALSLWRHDNYETDFILKRYGEILPVRDKVEALKSTGRIGKAMEQAFRGLDRNRYDNGLWEQFRELVSNYGNCVRVEYHYIKRGGYKEIMNKGSLKIRKGSLDLKLSNKMESKVREDKETITNSPSVIDELQFSITRTFERWRLTGYMGLLDSLRSRPFFGVKYHGDMSHNTSISLEMAFNKRSDDTLFLYIGGMKRYMDIRISKSLLPHLSATFTNHYNRYYSQDDHYLGYGFGEYLEMLYMLRFGYPDMGIRFYLQHETYNEKQGYKGVIEKISPYRENPVLPDTFNQMGMGIMLGYQNRKRLGKRWMPFFRLDTSINDKTGPGLFLEGGISSPSLLSHDHLDMGMSYVRGFRGTEDNYYDFFLRWKFYF